MRSVPSVDPARIDSMLADMQAAFPDATVSGFEPLVGDMANHPSDRHVLAAAAPHLHAVGPSCRGSRRSVTSSHAR